MARIARSRYNHPSKAELGLMRLKPDKNRLRTARIRAAKMIIEGCTRTEIVDYIMEAFEYSESIAGDIYVKAQKNMDRRYKDFCTKAANINYVRLDEIIEDAMDNGNSKVAIDAIDKQNKLAGVYENKITVKTEEPVKINFD